MTSNILSQRKELKAFMKSKYTIQWLSSVASMHPSGMDCCFCTSLDAKPELPWCQEGGQFLLHFVRSNLSNKTAEGNSPQWGRSPPPPPPSSLWRAVRLVPKKKGQMDDGVLPSSISCTKETSAGRRTWWLV